jgi:hypothetical protein
MEPDGVTHGAERFFGFRKLAGVEMVRLAALGFDGGFENVVAGFEGIQLRLERFPMGFVTGGSGAEKVVVEGGQRRVGLVEEILKPLTECFIVLV